MKERERIREKKNIEIYTYTQSFCGVGSFLILSGRHLTFLTSRSNSPLLRERESYASSITAKFNFNGTVFTLERCQVVCVCIVIILLMKKKSKNYIVCIV